MLDIVDIQINTYGCMLLLVKQSSFSENMHIAISTSEKYIVVNTFHLCLQRDPPIMTFESVITHQTSDTDV